MVPDIVQYATIRAGLEDLDGIPIINLNETPLQGWNSMLKRLMDVSLGLALLLLLTVLVPLLPLIALLIKLRGGRGPVLYRQERMSLDGQDLPDVQVPLHARRGRAGRPGRSGRRPRTTRAHARRAPSCGASTSTSCRSSSTCSRAT